MGTRLPHTGASQESHPASKVRTSNKLPSILVAPSQRFADDLALIRAGEMPQKPITNFLVNEGSKHIHLRTSPNVQLDRKMVVIDDALKRRRISQVCADRYTLHFEPSVQLGPEAQNPLSLVRSCALLRRPERCSLRQSVPWAGSSFR
jgi:hypothetical protein